MILLEKIVFYLLVFCLPWQTRKIMYQWGEGFNEWTSAYLYLTDILIILLFLFWIWRVRKQRFLKNFKIFQLRNYSFWLSAFLLVSLISLIQARNLPLGFYTWFKLLEFIGLFFYLKYNRGEILNFKQIGHVLIASGLFQSLIAIGQFISQKSLGLWFLTESPLGPEISGVAKVVVNNLTFIRSYGSLPHANILAAFLLICIFFTYYFWLGRKHSFVKNFLFIFVFSILAFALGLTFSRIIIVLSILASLIYFILIYRHTLKRGEVALAKRIIWIFVSLVILCSVFVVLAWPEFSTRFSISPEEQSVALRGFYNEVSYNTIQEYPWLGIGLGNFVWEMKEMLNLLLNWIHQPVHNIYLLVASETGLIGLFLFLMFLYQLLRQFKEKVKEKRQCCLLLIILISFLLIGLFDHFFWTLQQGQLMFWLVLGLLSGRIFHSLDILEIDEL